MNKSIIKSIGIVGLVIFLSKFIGFYREIAVACSLGTDYRADAFIVASQLPVIIFSGFGYAITTSFIPIYAKVQKIGDTEAQRFTNNIINIFIIFSMIIFGISLFCLRSIVKIIGYGFDENTLNLTYQISLVLLPIIVILSIAQLISGYLQSNGYKAITAAVNIPSSVFVIIALFYIDKIGVLGVSYALLAGYVFQVIIQFPSLYKCGYKHYFYINFKDENLREVISLVLAVFIVYLAYQINLVIDRSMASTLGEGIVACMNYATKLNQFVYGIVSVTTSIVLYPQIAKYALNADIKKLSSIMGVAVVGLIGIIIPIVLGGYVIAKDLTEFIFMRGKFEYGDVIVTAGLLQLYLIGLAGLVFRDLLSKCLYSINEQRFAVVNSVLVVTINIILNFILINFFEEKGLALATSISAIIGAAFLFRKMVTKLNSWFLKFVAVNSLKIVLASIVMMITLCLNTLWIADYSLICRLILNIGISIVVYLICIVILFYNQFIDFKNNRI